LNLSVIIPVLNERTGLPETIRQVQACLPGAEIVVADGGSSDGTREWVQERQDLTLVDAERGRGPQMNAGALASAGDVLLFLHADCLLPPGAGVAVYGALADPATGGGAFQIRFPAGSSLALNRLARLINFRSCLVSEATGDQAIFVRRAAFAAAGGFPNWPLFEDMALVSRLKRHGRFRIAPEFVVISPRRWEAHGVWRASLLMCLLYLGYKVGVAPKTLKRWFVDVRPAQG
jgi:rSAM/selenodomain-associated transferase 2